jgi:hypothetical protein
MTKLLEGEYVGSTSAFDDAGVRQKIAELEHENHQLISGQRQLRQILMPLYQALRSIMENLPAESNANDFPHPDVPARVSAVWEDWKRKVPQPSARIIDALLLHDNLNTQQLAVAAHMHRNNVPKYIWHLNKAGLIDKNGGRYSLKKL